MDVPVVWDLRAGVTKELGNNLNLHAPGVQVACERVPQRVQTSVFHARRLTGLLHGGQQIPAAQVLTGLGCEHVGTSCYLLGFEGELFTLVLPYANTVCINVFLEELSRKYPDDYILLVLDNAAWHHSGALVVPENIRLYPLLPYTPELNPIEMIWDDIREKGFRNEIFATFNKVIDRLCQSVRNLMSHPERVASITHRK